LASRSVSKAEGRRFDPALDHKDLFATDPRKRHAPPLAAGDCEEPILPVSDPWAPLVIACGSHAGPGRLKVRRGFRAAGWVLLALAVLALAVTVSVGALRAHGAAEFSRWVGWATVAAVPLAAAGVLLLLWDKIKGSLARPKIGDDNSEGAQARGLRRQRMRLLPRIGRPGADAQALGVHATIPRSDADNGTVAMVGIRSQLHKLVWSRPARWIRRQIHSWGDRADSGLPTFVDRDLGPQVRQWLHDARTTGGFLLIVGDSSVGKTRLLYEAAREVLPDFKVLAPARGAGNWVNAIAETGFQLPRKLIVWLDELQRFLDGPYIDRSRGETTISAAAVRHLLSSATPVVILGTMWPEHASNLRAEERSSASGVQRPRYPGAADVLTHPQVRELSLNTFSANERADAARLSDPNPRVSE
jgi:hypothetical protein